MTISDVNRVKFELLGRESIAHALATGTYQSVGLSESTKDEAWEWVKEQDAERDAAKRLETARYKTIRWWTIVAAVASTIAAIAAVISIFR